MAFDYVLSRIRDAEFLTFPFKHLEIDGLFSERDFAAITSAPEIRTGGYSSDDALFEALFATGYKIIDFPGSVNNHRTYMKWHANRGPIGKHNQDTCEAFGVTLRLHEPVTPVVRDLIDFLASESFRCVLAEKFNLDMDEITHDYGVQKYLDGYEISPHADIRAKALTYMVNINPYIGSEDQDHHTQYLTLRDEFKYLSSYWQGNKTVERCWVPWIWCDVQKQQRRNNSMVIFSPNNESFHAVRARYDHLRDQRTQLYGNFWLSEIDVRAHPDWSQLVIRPETRATPSRGFLNSLAPRAIRRVLGADHRRGADVAVHVPMVDRLKWD